MPLPTLAVSTIPSTMFRSVFSAASKSARSLQMRSFITNAAKMRHSGMVVGSVTAASFGIAWAARSARAFAAPANGPEATPAPTPAPAPPAPAAPQLDPSISEIRKADITLYQYEVCPFCNKVRAFLDYHRIPYRVVEVNPLRKTEIAFSKQYRKVPIIVLNGQQFNDSDGIIDLFNAYLLKEKDAKANPLTEADQKWRTFINNVLSKLVSPNLYRTPSEALHAFDYISTHSKYDPFEQTLIRYTGAATMYLIARSNKKKLGIVDERSSMYKAFNHWLEEVGDKPFHGGERPDIADLAIFGMARALSHFSVWPDLVANTKVEGWYKRVEAAVGPSARL